MLTADNNNTQQQQRQLQPSVFVQSQKPALSTVDSHVIQETITTPTDGSILQSPNSTDKEAIAAPPLPVREQMPVEPSKHSDVSVNTTTSELDKLNAMIRDKEAKIQQLFQEGQQLASLNGRLRDAAKKLKARDTESQKALTELQLKYTGTMNQCAALTAQVSQLSISERKLQDLNQQSSDNSSMLSKTIAKLENDLKMTRDQGQSIQQSLEQAWKDVADLKKQLVDVSGQMQSDALANELSISNTLRLDLETAHKEHQLELMQLKKELYETRSSLARLQSESEWQQEHSRKELYTYQQRLQDSESRLEELMANAQESTRPLLRQIDALQSQLSAAQMSFEGVEKQLVSRLQLSESAKEESVKSERRSKQLCDDMTGRIRTLEGRITEMENIQISSSLEIKQLLVSVESYKVKVLELERQLSEAENVNSQPDTQDVDILVNQRLEMAEVEWRQREVVLMSQLLSRNAEIDRLSAVRQAKKPPSLDNITVTKPANLMSPGPISPKSLAEQLQSNAKHTQLQEQITTLMSQMESVSKMRDQLADEILSLTNNNLELQEQVKRVPMLETDVQQIHSRYCKTVELSNQRALRIEELETDIGDMKDMYKSQIQELLSQLDRK